MAAVAARNRATSAPGSQCQMPVGSSVRDPSRAGDPGGVLQGQADREEPLDDQVVQVAADPVAVLEHGQPGPVVLGHRESDDIDYRDVVLAQLAFVLGTRP